MFNESDLQAWLARHREELRQASGIAPRVSRRSETSEAAADDAIGSARTAARSKQTRRGAADQFLTKNYPEGIPAGKGNKQLAREFTDRTGVSISPRTIRRARTDRQ